MSAVELISGVHNSMSYVHGGDSTPLVRCCVGEILDATAFCYPDQFAVISRHQQVRICYQDLRKNIQLCAGGLLRLGVVKGDRLALWASNCVEWVIVQFAAAKIGAILVTLNPTYRVNELDTILRQSECQTLVMTSAFRACDHVSAFLELCPQAESSRPGHLSCETYPSLRNVIVIGERGCPGFFSWEELQAMGEGYSIRDLEVREKELTFDDPVNIQYTSGTTGKVKGVTLSHHNIVNNARLTAFAMKLTEKDRICLPVPFYHCFGMVLGSIAAIAIGAAIVIPDDHFDALTTLQAIAEERCTALYGVPTMFIRELEHPALRRLDLQSLRTGNIGGAPCPATLVQRIMEEMHCHEITIGYGLTEASPIITQTTVSDAMDLRRSTVGRPLPHTEVKIIDVSGREIVLPGVAGELCTRGYGVMKGYYNDEEATRAAIDQEGWLHTGDLATMDVNGYCRIVGRLKDVINRGGEKVYPREIEELLHTCPAISEAHVFGLPDGEYGEKVAAWVRLRPGCTMSSSDIKEFCQRKIAEYKIPRCIKIVNDFPKTANGKIQKFRIREISIQELGLQSA
jgi:fatty-acyl-CoA synthase